MIVLTNGRVAWPLGGYIGDRYYHSIYLPPDGWQVKEYGLHPLEWEREVCGNYRFKERYRFTVEVDHD